MSRVYLTLAAGLAAILVLAGGTPARGLDAPSPSGAPWAERLAAYTIEPLAAHAVALDAADGRVTLALRGTTYELSVTPVRWDASPPAFETGDDGIARPVARAVETVAYRGALVGEPGSRAFLQITAAGVDGSIRRDGEWFQFAPLAIYEGSAVALPFVIVYDTEDYLLKPGAFDDEPPLPDAPLLAAAHGEAFAAASATTPRLLQFADSNFRSQWGSNWLSQLDVIVNWFIWTYEDEAGWTFTRNAVQSCTTSSCDSGWGVASNNAVTLRDNFAAKAKEKRDAGSVTAFDIAHLFSGRDFDGTTDGLAYLAGRYAISQHRSGQLSWYSSMLVAHEVGHNFNGRHEHAEKWTTQETRRETYCKLGPYPIVGCLQTGERDVTFTRTHYTIMHPSATHNGTDQSWHDEFSDQNWLNLIRCNDGTWAGLSFTPGSYTCT